MTIYRIYFDHPYESFSVKFDSIGEEFDSYTWESAKEYRDELIADMIDNGEIDPDRIETEEDFIWAADPRYENAEFRIYIEVS